MTNSISHNSDHDSIILKGIHAHPALVDYAVIRLRDGDCECYSKYMNIANELSNINYFFTLVPYYTTEDTDNYTVDGIVCLFNNLIDILNSCNSII